MKKSTLAAGLAAFALSGLVIAQQAGFTRTALQTQDLSTPGKVAGLSFASTVRHPES